MRIRLYQMESLTQFQKQFWKKILSRKREAELEIQDRSLYIDEHLKKEILAPGSDQRFGVNLIARPPKEISYYIASIQDRLRIEDPNQHYYDEANLHLTYFEILSGADKREANKTANRLLSKIDRIVDNIKATKVVMSEIIVDNKSCALFFLPKNQSLQHGRNYINKSLKRLSIDNKKRYFPIYAHIVFLRYVRSLAVRKRKWIKTINSIELKSSLVWNINKLYLTWGPTWYGFRNFLNEEGPFLLKSEDSDG